MDAELVNQTARAGICHKSFRRIRRIIILVALATLSVGYPNSSQAQDEECDEFMDLEIRIPPRQSVTISENKGFELEFVAQLFPPDSGPAPAWLFILRQNGTTGKMEEVDRWKEILRGEVLIRNLIKIPLNKRKQGFHLLGARSQCDSGYAATADLFDIKYSEQPNEQPSDQPNEQADANEQADEGVQPSDDGS